MADLHLIMLFLGGSNSEIHLMHMDFKRVRFHASTTICKIISHIAWAMWPIWFVKVGGCRLYIYKLGLYARIYCNFQICLTDDSGLCGCLSSSKPQQVHPEAAGGSHKHRPHSADKHKHKYEMRRSRDLKDDTRKSRTSLQDDRKSSPRY